MNIRSLKAYMNKIPEGRGFKNTYRIIDNKYVFTDSYSIMVLNETNTMFKENNYIKDGIKQYIDKFNTFKLVSEIDIHSDEFKSKDDTNCNIDKDYGYDKKRVKSVMNCINGKKVLIMASEDKHSYFLYVIKVESDNGDYGYISPTRNF